MILFSIENQKHNVIQMCRQTSIYICVILVCFSIFVYNVVYLYCGSVII